MPKYLLFSLLKNTKYYWKNYVNLKHKIFYLKIRKRYLKNHINLKINAQQGGNYRWCNALAVHLASAADAMHRGPSTRGTRIATFSYKIFLLKALVNLLLIG